MGGHTGWIAYNNEFTMRTIQKNEKTPKVTFSMTEDSKRGKILGWFHPKNRKHASMK
jgi:hypothetical protein